MTENKMSVSLSAPVIKKVTMVENGRMGLDIIYTCSINRNGLVAQVEDRNKQKRAVQKEIRDSFNTLKKHLLRSAGYYWPNEKVLDLLSANTTVKTVSMTDKGIIQIIGEMAVMNGAYYVDVKGAAAMEEDFEQADELKEIVNTIWKEAGLFMSGSKGANKKTIVTDYMASKKNIENAETAYDSMTKEEIEEITREALAESGIQVFEEDGEMVVGIKDTENEEVNTKTAEEVQSLEEISEEPAFEEPIDLSNVNPDEDLFM